MNEIKLPETKWHWRPIAAVENNPLFAFPFKFKKILHWYIQAWKPLSEYSYFIMLSLLVWFYLQPQLEQFSHAETQSILSVYSRNLFVTLLTAGGLHLYFYTFARQGLERKYEKRGMLSNSKLFTFNDQVYDNMFWTLVSGVTIWTAYEILLYWGLANGYAPSHSWSDGKVWFVALFFVIPIWISLHFFVNHWVLHWPPLYKISHAIHHRNISTGPWSGISMHPIEHLLYLSSLLIHFLIPSHPIHIMFHAYGLTLGAIFGHVGYDSLLFRGKPVMAIGHFHHQLHHRHFECNYGASELPCDTWMGTFDDGSPQARQRIKERTRIRSEANKKVQRG
jgi:sterol desaturase/sphingolipid hydroxylase (fatty acid hydroxylase superfamily)